MEEMRPRNGSTGSPSPPQEKEGRGAWDAEQSGELRGRGTVGEDRVVCCPFVVTKDGGRWPRVRK